MQISDEAVEAAVDSLVASRLGDHKGINGEKFVEAARAALEAAAPHMQVASADERAMQDIRALLDEYFSDVSRIVEVDVVMRLARIVGTYDAKRIGGQG